MSHTTPSPGGVARSPHRKRGTNLEGLLAAGEAAVGFVVNSPRSLEVCRRHGILPEELIPRAPQSFVEYRDEMPEMIQRRFDHFNTRRLEKLNFLVEERRGLILQQEEAATASVGGVHAVAQSPAPQGVLYNDTFDAESMRLETRIRKEELRQQKCDLVKQAQEDLQRQREQKLAWSEQRHSEMIHEQEERKQRQIYEGASKKMVRREQAAETQRLLTDITEQRRAVLIGKEEERSRALQDKRHEQDMIREQKRQQQQQRAAEIRARKEEMERNRALNLEMRIHGKNERALEHEQGILAAQTARQRALEKQTRMAALKASSARGSHHHEAEISHAVPNLESNMMEQRAAAEQMKAEAKARKMDEVKQRQKEIDEVRRAQALSRLQEKEAKQNQALEAAKQQQLWELNEKRLRSIDAKEAVERQKRKEAYELEQKQRAVQNKMERLAGAEEAKWRSIQEKRIRLESLRNQGTGALTPRTTPRRSSLGPRYSIGGSMRS